MDTETREIHWVSCSFSSSGSFQGLHLGHMEYLLAGTALRTSSGGRDPLSLDPWGTPRRGAPGSGPHERLANPFTYYERLAMLGMHSPRRTSPGAL